MIKDMFISEFELDKSDLNYFKITPKYLLSIFLFDYY